MSILNFIAADASRLAMVPFAVLLLAIALAPLIAQHHWERHYHKLCVALAGIVCLYHLFIVKESARVVHAGIDYATFMVVVGSFFVVAGGIHLRVKSPSGAMRNTLFLIVGALFPVGPPLFLGFLKGVPFGWALQNCWRQWLFTLAIVLVIFFLLDLI